MMGRGKAFEVPNPNRRPTPAETTDLTDESSLGFIPTQVLLRKPIPEASIPAKAPEPSTPGRASVGRAFIGRKKRLFMSIKNAKTAENEGGMELYGAYKGKTVENEGGTELYGAYKAKTVENEGGTYKAKTIENEGGTYKAKTVENEGGTTKEDWSPSMDGITGEVPPGIAYWMRRNSRSRSRFTNEGGGSKARFMENNNNDGVKETEDEIVEKVLYGSGRSRLPVFQELCREKDNNDQAKTSKGKDKDEAMCMEEDNDYVIV